MSTKSPKSTQIDALEEQFAAAQQAIEKLHTIIKRILAQEAPEVREAMERCANTEEE